MRHHDQNLTPKQILLITRINWTTLLLVQLLFFGFVVFPQILNGNAVSGAPDIIYYVAIVYGLISVPLASFIRMQIYKRFWVENCVTPNGYKLGMVVSQGILEGAGFFSLIAVMLHGKLDLTIVLPVVLLVVFIMNFPNGKPMEPAIPDYLNQPLDHQNK